MPPQRKGKRTTAKTPATSKPANGNKGKRPQNKKLKISEVYEADDDDRELTRKGHDLDEVDDYEYHVDKVDPEDDEEIDSDDAFDEEAEQMYGGINFPSSKKSTGKKKKVHFSDEEQEASEPEIDMNESEHGSDEEEEDEDGEGYMDLSEMLEAESSSEEAEPSTEFAELEGFASDSDEDKEEEEEPEEDKTEEVANFINSLETRKRKRNDNPREGKKSKQQEVTEGTHESEFNMLAKTTAESKNTLDLNDLMESMNDEAAFTSLRKSLLELDGKGKHVVKAALEAPLAKRIQDRVDRQAAYKEAKKEVSRWQATVDENRTAEHLTFPLQAPMKEKTTSATLATNFKPQTELEKQIQDALQQAGMKDEELEAFESLKLNKLSVEEMEARRQELRLARELMFRHEIKARRLKKIKSKSYRKLQRKEKLKLQMTLAQLDSSLDHEMDEDEQMKAAMNRAEERMSLKHKNTSKWVKRALARGQKDEGTRDAIMEQLRRGEELRRKMQGGDSDEDSDGSYDSDDDVDPKEQVAKELAKLEKEIDEEDTPAPKGLFSMKFMQEAAKRNMAATKGMIDDFKAEWLNEDDDQPKEPTAHAVVQNNPGRLAFGVNKETKATANTIANQKPEAEKKANGHANDARAQKSNKNTEPEAPKSGLDVDLDHLEEVSPWLQQVESKIQGKKASKKNKSKGKIEDKSELNTEKIKKSRKAIEAENEEDVQLDMTKAITSKTKSTKAMTVVSTGDSDNEEEEANMTHASNKIAFAQRELVAQAFAHDNVVEEFEEEKNAIVKEDGDQEEDLTLPGWGAWAGKGIKKSKKKVVVVKTKGIDPSKRKDAKLANVIINEKKNKKVEKYQVTQVPFPFQNMEQYERSLRAPVGKEWNTTDTFQKMTKPRIMTKLGSVIDPLHAPFK